MTKVYPLLIVAVLLLCSITLRAQEKDFGTHLEAEFEKKITRKIELQASEELRFNQNLSAFDRSMTTFAGVYSLSKAFKVGLFYTYIYANNQEDGYYESRHRFGGWLQASRNLGRFRVALREKYTDTYRDESLGNFKYNPKMYLKSKLEVSYDIRSNPLNPFFSTEMSLQLNNPYGNDIDKWRFTLGADYHVSRKFELSPFVRLDKEVNIKNPINIFILGLTAKFKLQENQKR